MEHYQTRLTGTSPFVEQICPVTHSPLKIGDQIVICKKHDAAYSLEGWNFLDSCPYCHEATGIDINLRPQTEHYQTRLTADSPFIGQFCPVTRVSFKVGDQIVICKKHNAAYSLEGWDSLGVCPTCHKTIINGATTSSQNNQPLIQLLGIVGILFLLFIGVGTIATIWKNWESHLATPTLQLSSFVIETIIPSPTATPTYQHPKSPTPTRTVPPKPTQAPTSTLAKIPSATSVNTSERITPEQFIREYFKAINNRNYKKTWNMLSDNFKDRFHCCNSDGTYQYQPYVDWWNTVDHVDVLEVIVTQNSANLAKVQVLLKFTYKDGRVVENTLNWELVPNSSGDSWLFN